MSPDPADDDFLDADDEAFLAEWEAAERDAAGVVKEALAAHRGAPPPAGALAAAGDQVRRGIAEGAYPLSWLAQGAGLAGHPPDDDEELMLALLAASIAPREDPGLPSEEQASIMSLELGDWAGAVIELVRGGPGAPANPDALADAIDRCPEVEGPPIEPGDSSYTLPFELVGFAWEAAGVLDDRRRLTPLGAWILPRALCRAWGESFD